MSVVASNARLASILDFMVGMPRRWATDFDVDDFTGAAAEVSRALAPSFADAPRATGMASTDTAPASINAALASKSRAAAGTFPADPIARPATSGPTSWPRANAAVNQPKAVSMRPSGTNLAMADCPAVVKHKCPIPSTALATPTSSRDGAADSRSGPAASRSVPTRVMPFIDVLRSDIRPSHRAIATGRRAKEAEVRPTATESPPRANTL
jgi:hypothetical protein